tara:strand:- start:4609 stop:4896 length:288 start_codon:yes stop_codon:yes gene_type:complete
LKEYRKERAMAKKREDFSRFVGDGSEIEFEDEAEEKEMTFPQCIVCEHLISADEETCEAYPEGIPGPLFYGEISHTKPYKGDNGLRFDAIEEILR